MTEDDELSRASTIRLLSQGLTIKFISQLTGLSEEEITKLKYSHIVNENKLD